MHLESIEEKKMHKTKLQLYNELKELTEENRKQIKEILDELVESGALSTYTLNVPKCSNFNYLYDTEPKKLEEYLDNYIETEVDYFQEFCEYREISLQSADIENPEFYESICFSFCPQADNTILEDLFQYINFSYQTELKDFIEDYLEHGDSFTEYLCDNGFISADIYSEGFYDLVAVRELSLIFAECENFFKDELDKLKMIQTSLYECRNRLNKISDKFEQNFIEYLDDMGYCDNE